MQSQNGSSVIGAQLAMASRTMGGTSMPLLSSTKATGTIAAGLCLGLFATLYIGRKSYGPIEKAVGLSVERNWDRRRSGGVVVAALGTARVATARARCEHD